MECYYDARNNNRMGNNRMNRSSDQMCNRRMRFGMNRSNMNSCMRGEEKSNGCSRCGNERMGNRNGDSSGCNRSERGGNQSNSRCSRCGNERIENREENI